MAEQLSRKELYNLVWAQPIKTLAARFNISDVALKKTCARAAIPVPARGHWAKKAAGKKTVKADLPPRPPGMDDEVLVGGGGRYWYRHWTREELLGPLPSPPKFEEPLEAVRERNLQSHRQGISAAKHQGLAPCNRSPFARRRTSTRKEAHVAL